MAYRVFAGAVVIAAGVLLAAAPTGAADKNKHGAKKVAQREYMTCRKKNMACGGPETPNKPEKPEPVHPDRPDRTPPADVVVRHAMLTENRIRDYKQSQADHFQAPSPEVINALRARHEHCTTDARYCN